MANFYFDDEQEKQEFLTEPTEPEVSPEVAEWVKQRADEAERILYTKGPEEAKKTIKWAAENDPDGRYTLEANYRRMNHQSTGEDLMTGLKSIPDEAFAVEDKRTPPSGIDKHNLAEKLDEAMRRPIND